MDKILNRAADNIRILSASMVEKAKSGHPGGAMGGADFVNVLYSQFLNFDPDDMSWANRDRFFLDPGHMSPMLYSILSLVGTYSMEDLQNFRQWGSVTPGHPEVDVKRGVENTSGPLGQGHAMAVGAAIAERFLVARFGEWMAHKTYAFISDGGIQEEISQGAGRIAGTLGLSNLIMFYDANEVQLSTRVNEVTREDTAMKYKAWGWNVITVNGNDAKEITEALKAANEEKERPTLIIGKTLMGKGAVGADGEDFSDKVSTHGQPLSAAGASIEKTIENLGGDPQHPFVIFPEVKEFYNKVLEQKRAYAKAKKAEQAAWEKANPELAAKWHRFLSGKAPEIDYKSIVHKPGIATRAASADVLVELAKQVENMIVSSADLSNSDKTDGFIKGGARNLIKGDFSGAFFQAGVAELTMAVICNGIALHGGIFVACGTFFVFSDYMKPAVRLAALMEIPVKFIWSHDAFRVGEDGPTHQPIEHEAQLRLMEKLHNHSGKMSLLALRPADAAETSVAWKMAMENTSTPTALILSRQNIKDLPGGFDEALQAEKGAYVVTKNAENVDIVLIASGSEVSTLLEGAQLLKERKGISSQVVSVISEGLFREQSSTYQEEVIPANKPKYGLTAGLPVTLEGLVGINGRIHGVNHFGYSAPAKVLDEKFGFTGENVYNEVCEMLKR
ncbi:MULTISPECIES: transketolase family protein [Sanguibacteroides]|uniref:transketolase n=1 Tax=Sanguibacteroides justesenii TaxID=1547597 RepID=A0AB34R0R2_9PORP|nr:transketolase [Sanguibacteroides justesenii]PXZ45347.1 transketolase [Sanguibacteroides justesenii]